LLLSREVLLIGVTITLVGFPLEAGPEKRKAMLAWCNAAIRFHRLCGPGAKRVSPAGEAPCGCDKM
jgi:hypothetical protein